MDKLKMHTPDLTQAHIARIREVFPGCVTETRDEQGKLKLAIDFDQLKQELSDSIVEGPQERYHLNWPGKREALLTANAPIAKTLRPARAESVNFDTTQNLFIEGDNLEALKLLQETYLGKVKMIYIDPPYNTGGDFLYDDDYSQNTKEFLIKSNQQDQNSNRLVANQEANGRFHSDWLSMIYPRLKLSKNLLSENGIIFVSIDDSEISNLIQLMREIFGEDNQCAIIHRRKNRKPHNAGHTMSLSYEFIVAFYKDHKFKLSQEFSEMSSDEKGNFAIYPVVKADKKERIYTFPKGIKCFCVNLQKGIVEAGRNSNLNLEILDVPIVANCILQNDIRIKGRFCLTDENGMLSQAIKNENIFINENGFPKEKRYRTEEDSKIDNHHWDIDKGKNEDGDEEIKELFDLKGENNLFKYPKPIALITKILESINDKEALVLDFFGGSGTTADALIRQNNRDGGSRKFVLIQIAEPLIRDKKEQKDAYDFCTENNLRHSIAEISKERIRRAGKKIIEGQCHEGWNKDIGFRVLKIDTSNMADVYYTPDGVTQQNLLAAVDNIKPDRTHEDLLFQVLLDWGVDLTLPIQRTTVQGKTVYTVDGNALVACFETGITEDLVKELAALKPLRVVFRDTGFTSDAVKINAEQIFKQLSPSTDMKAI
ncbi:MAG: site-specific DNA-methyltransferase [Pseudomonadaceae bacterium]|nr:site-specific DNA-methyltransferase [Pseudomonadaceae bacterium]